MTKTPLLEYTNLPQKRLAVRPQVLNDPIHRILSIDSGAFDQSRAIEICNTLSACLSISQKALIELLPIPLPDSRRYLMN
jgi:hypothetical protein